MAWDFGIASNTTVREVATVATGGSSVRVRISNFLGDQPLLIAAATIAVDSTAATVVPSTMQPLTFDNAAGISIPVGSVAYSDPVAMVVTPLEALAISVYVSGTDTVTLHPCCTTPDVSFYTANGGGNRTTAPDGSAFAYASPWPRWVDAVDVLSGAATASLSGSAGTRPAHSGPTTTTTTTTTSSSAGPARSTGDPNGSIVVLGDSITDGFNATVRWTDVLQRRIDTLPLDEQRAVINEGISANTLTDTARNFSKTGGGPSGIDRLERDALSQSGVSTVVVFLGTNDLYFGADGSQVIAGLQQIASEIHQAGLRAVGVTLLPRMAGPEPWSPTEQSYLEQINQWLLTSHAFDAVIDLASTVADVYNGQCTPTSIFAPYDSGDHLHPDNAGQVAMADAITGAELGLPPLPQVPSQVAVTPTPGCTGVPGIPAPTALSG